MKERIASVDIFRALTMLLMIFVNDLWTLGNIPGWLEHTTAKEDGMGLADVVFPAFLFIVGLSIPFAIQTRIKNGDSRIRILLHIARRTLALLVMGFFMVNHENYRSDIPQLTRTLWEVFMILAFMLVWNSYRNERFLGKIPVWFLQAAGIFILIVLALIYKGGTPTEAQWMRPHWWGILGLIGWAYLICSVLYLFSGKRLWIIVVFWIILHAFNVQEFIPLSGTGKGFRLMVSASNHALVMSGVLATSIYIRSKSSNKFLFPLLLLIPAVISLIYGYSLRPLWGISKIMATPSWTGICAGISFVALAIIYWITDILKSVRWADILMPAGRSTLTCYLIPGLVYPVLWPLQQLLPRFFLEGLAGILKSILFALLIVFLTGLLEKIHIRLKI